MPENNSENIDISLIPEPDVDFLEAAKNHQLAIFIGAGVSRLVGCLGWDELAHRLINRCYAENIINYREKETLKNESDSRKLISIAKIMLEKKEKERVFYEEMENAILFGESKKGKEELNNINIYHHLYRIPAVFITTNADDHFDQILIPEYVHRDPIKLYQQYQKTEEKNGHIFHIHGQIEERDTLVFDLKRYIEVYANAKFKAFLREIFENYTILFIGYGLSELELLEHLVKKVDEEKKEIKPRILLAPFFSSDENIFQYAQEYYRELSIKIIPYKLDSRGYDQLYEVIKKWADIIQDNKLDIHRNTEEIRRNVSEIAQISKCSEQKKINYVQRIYNIKPDFRFFLDTIIKDNAILEWFDVLKSLSLFEPDKHPLEANNESTDPKWEILDYYQCLLDIYKIEKTDSIYNFIKNFVDAYISYQLDEDNRTIKNFHTDLIILKSTFLLENFDYTDQHFEYLIFSINQYNYSFTGLFLELIYEKAIPYYNQLESCKYLCGIIKTIFVYTIKDDRTNKEIEFRYYGSYFVPKITQKHSTELVRHCSFEVSTVLENLINEILEKIKYAFNCMKIPYIDEGSSHIFPEKYEYQLILFLFNSVQQLNEADLKFKIKKYLEPGFPIFKRLALTLISNNYEQCSHLFWNLEENPFSFNTVKHEMYLLINKNHNAFTKENVEQYEKWVEEDANNLSNKADENQKDGKYRYQIKKWLDLLEDKTKYLSEKSKKILGQIDYEYREEDYYDWWVGDPYWEDDKVELQNLLLQSNKEIAEWCNTNFVYDSDSNVEFDKNYHYESELSNAISSKPEEFLKNIAVFNKVPFPAKLAILSGFRLYFDQKEKVKPININPLFEFINSCINDINKGEAIQQHHRDKLVMLASSVIDVALEKRFREIGIIKPTQYDKVLKIIENLDKIEVETVLYNDQLQYQILNRPKGKLYSLLVFFYWINAKSSDKVSDIENKCKTLINSEISNQQNIEILYFVGARFPQFYDIDQEWALEIARSIRDAPEDYNNTFMFGYCFHINYVYVPVHKLFIEFGLFEKALNNIANPDVIDRIIHFSVFDFFHQEENTIESESLLKLIFDRKNPEELRRIISFVQHFKKDEKFRNQKKLRILFLKLIRLLKRTENENVVLIGELFGWLKLFNKYDAYLKKKFKYLAKFATLSEYHLYDSIKIMKEFVEDEPKFVGEMLQEIFSNIRDNYINPEELTSLIKAIKDTNKYDKIDELCKLGISQGFYYLAGILVDKPNDKNLEGSDSPDTEPQ